MKPFYFAALLMMLVVSNSYASNCDVRSPAYLSQLEKSLTAISDADKDYWRTLPADAEVIDIRIDLHKNFYTSCLHEQITEHYLSGLDEPELKKLTKLLSSHSFYSQLYSSTQLFEKAIKELESRNSEVKPWADELVSRFVKHRRFTEANLLVSKYGLRDKNPLPTIINGENLKAQSLLITNDQRTEFQSIDFEIGSGLKIIVVSSPMCGPSKRFLSWLKERPDYLRIFVRHSIWVAPASNSLHLDLLENRNNILPDLPLHFVYDPSDWSEIDYWGTPTFYIYSNGVRVKQIVGWPKEGREKELAAALQPFI